MRADFHHAPVLGGGFVTGFAFHPTQRGILYARTDIGGVYRYLPERRRWLSLCDGVPHSRRWETFPLSIALSAADPDALYVAAGDWHTNRLCVSFDRGGTFDYREVPAGIHGNAPGRGTGERLWVSPRDPLFLRFASQSEGLLTSYDGGHTWQAAPVCGETNLTLCFVHPDNDQVLILGTSGGHNRRDGRTRGPSLYGSRDGGLTFQPLPGQPAPLADPRASHAGYVAQRAAFDGHYLYVTFNMPGDCWRGFDSYACDTGTSFDGALLRYQWRADGEISGALDLTPVGYTDPGCPARRLGCGLSGIDVDRRRPGTVILSTICAKGGGDTLYHSADHGLSWTPVLRGLSVGHIDFTVPYMRPPYNGNRSIVHWMADLRIDPHDSDMAVFTTGTGIFATFNLTAAPRGETVSWLPLCDGLEETVHLNVYSPPTGRVRLLDIIGDLGGFAFENPDQPCENSFADEQGNRYITCMNADFLDDAPAPVCVTARGNWTGRTKGGLILSDDDCRTWQRLPMPFGLSDELDALLRDIEKPNVNPGWVALGAGGGTIVWGVARDCALPIPALVYTRDKGQTWRRCEVYGTQGQPMEDPARTLKVFSDRANPRLFYGFGQEGALYASADGGASFFELPAGGLPAIDPTGIDGLQRHEIRPVPGASGLFYLSAREHGLFAVHIDAKRGAASARRVTGLGETVYRVGLGKPSPQSAMPALYINGILGGVYGFFASFDGGSSWERAGNDQQLFGDIRSIAGDPRTFGRFYIGTGSRGVLYGDLRG